MICTRCLGLIGSTAANYCPRCGWHLAAIRPFTPTLDDLKSFEASVAEMLPRLGEVHRRTEERRREAREMGYTAALDLLERRLLFLTRIEQRLIEHHRWVRGELRRRQQHGS